MKPNGKRKIEKQNIFRAIKWQLVRNRFLISWRRAQEHRVNINQADLYPNLGDQLSTVIVEKILQERGIPMDKPVRKTRHLLAVGSILGWADHDAAVWGSGILSPKVIVWLTQKGYIRLDVRAIRGPISRDVLTAMGYAVPEVYGDPAILLPRWFSLPPVPEEQKRDYGVIVHLDRVPPEDRAKHADKVIAITDTTLEAFLAQLAQCKKIISSSLHGIILAEAFGIPAVMLSTDVNDEILKYCDWYYSTGRCGFKVASSVEEAIAMEPMPLPDLEDMKARLLESFPWDLWEVQETGMKEKK